MNTDEFLEYIHENFNISVEAHRLIKNILNYIAAQCVDREEQYILAFALLDGTIGLEEEELRMIDV